MLRNKAKKKKLVLLLTECLIERVSEGQTISWRISLLKRLMCYLVFSSHMKLEVDEGRLYDLNPAVEEIG